MKKKCQHCGNIHGVRCPSIKAIEYFEDGTIRRVEYMTPADFYIPIQPCPAPSAPNYPPYAPFGPTWIGGSTSNSH